MMLHQPLPPPPPPAPPGHFKNVTLCTDRIANMPHIIHYFLEYLLRIVHLIDLFD